MAMTKEAREALIEERVEAHDPKKQEFLSLPWRDKTERFPVIELELDAVVLRPDSHRIRAQLESHEEADVINADPFSDKAQRLIASILRDTGENFEDLKRNLDEKGQLQFGVVTRAGLLVNANRRAAALKDLGKKYIDVAVLPPDTTLEEINDLELTLQMQRDFWEEYTFTNRLLFVEELINKQNRTRKEVALALNPAVSRDSRTMKRGIEEVEQDTRVLTMLREIQARSGKMIPLTSFDEQEVAVEELDTRYKDTHTQDPTGAKEMRDIRLLGILTDVPYRRLRHLDGEVLDEYVIPNLAENEVLGDVLPAVGGSDGEVKRTEGVPEGLGPLETDDESGKGDDPVDGNGEEPSAPAQVSALVDLVATTYRDDEVELPTEEGPRSVDRKTVVENLKGSLTDAALEVESDKKHDNRLTRPIKWAEEAERKLKSAADAFSELEDSEEFDSESFQAALAEVRNRLDALIADVDSAG